MPKTPSKPAKTPAKRTPKPRTPAAKKPVSRQKPKPAARRTPAKKGGRLGTAKQAAKQLEIDERRMKILELRKSGASIRRIAEHLGIGRSTVHDDLKAILAVYRKQLSLKSAEYVEMELQRLDDLQLSVWSRTMKKGGTFDIHAVLAIMDRRARLLGLDKPQKLELSARDALAKLLGKRPEELPDGSDS